MNLSEIEKIEALVLKATISYLRDLNPNISETSLDFLCAPWVHFFTHSAIHKYESFISSNQTAIPVRNDFTHNNNSHIPGDTLAFMEYSRTMEYSQYLERSLLGVHETIKCRSNTWVLVDKFPKTTETIAYMSCLPRYARYMITLASFGRVRFWENKPISIVVSTNWEWRYYLAKIIRSNLEHEFLYLSQWLAQRMLELFPKSLLEYLPSNLKNKNSSHPRKILFSANGWGIIDDWKVYAVIQRGDSKAKLIGSPHSVNYGWLLNFWQRDFEIHHLDRYLTWGWKMQSPSNLIPFSAPQFLGASCKLNLIKPLRSGVLISTAARPMHLLEYPYTPAKFKIYLNTQMQLANQVQRLTNDKVAIRTRPHDLGWNLTEMVRSIKNNHVAIEYQAGKFKNRLLKSRLHICDNCSTTIIESFIFNHPTLILLVPDYFEISTHAQIETQRLIDAGILHNTIDSLLEKLKNVNSQIDDWWNEKGTQNAISTFLDCQGRSDATFADWIRELRRYS